MSKYVKDLVSKDIARRLEGVEDALLVNVVGIEANSTVLLRKNLRAKGVGLLVVKNSMAKRATEGTPLAAAFEGAEGTLAMVWGLEDIISLAKEVVQIEKSGDFVGFEARGGVMDGEHLSAERVAEISKWPNRDEQLSILSGQILSPGANLLSQLESPGALLASQVEKKSEEGEEGEEGES